MKRACYFLLLVLATKAECQQTTFEKSNGKETATYVEAIQFYKSLSTKSKKIKIVTKGETDAGYPLLLVMISNDQSFNPDKWHKDEKVVIMINNGIHPGEPDGIDASMMLARDIVKNKITLPANVVIAIIPVYNIGGALNRNSFSRVNQNGPLSYGFRGNAQNLDLNRDFIKADSKNARSFTEIFHFLDPDILIDNHVSDGADYQHTMTLITTQHNKLGNILGTWVNDKFEPSLYAGIKRKGWDMVPYINVEDTDPSGGFTQFYDSPRYSSGYAALFNTISFMPETHMLKPYSQRVKSTYDLMLTMLEQASLQAKDLLEKRKKAIKETINQNTFFLSWVADTSQYVNISFKGYAAGERISEVTSLPILFYDHKKPYASEIKFYDTYHGVNLITKPKAYIIPQGWWQVIKLMKLNKVNMARLSIDSVIEVNAYHISNYKSYPKPYEKHHKNYEITVTKKTEKRKFLKGDYLIPLNQPANRYIIETLEPTGDDGFFAWNFFDAILQQKEGYSEYRFDTIAANVIKNNPALNKEFLSKKTEDSIFSKNGSAQLDFIYKNSPYYEPEYFAYPAYRIE